MKKQKLEEKSSELVESPEEMGPLSPASKDQEKKEPSGKPKEFSKKRNANPKKKAKWFLKEFLQEFFTNGIDNIYSKLSPSEQKRYVERFCITISVGLACVLSSFFYWLLPPLVRVLVIPVFIGTAWWFGAKVVLKLLTEEGTEQVLNSLKVVEFFHLLEAVKFSAVSFTVAAIPFWLMPSQFHAAVSSPDARLIFLAIFTWNLIGAPLYAQAQRGKARQLITLVFGVPAATVTLWWVNAILCLRIFEKTFVGIS